MFFNNYRKKLKSLYIRLDYPEVPYLPNNSDCQRIIESYNNFPAALIAKEYMIRNNQNLLQGDIILLWWLTQKKVKNISKYPQYFLYEYGIDFNKELIQLKSNGLVTKNNQLTTSGKTILENNSDSIKMHRAKKYYSPNSGKIKYESINDVNIHQTLRKPRDTTNESKMDDYYYAEEQRLELLWKLERFSSAEKLGNKLIQEGITYPAVFYRMAVLYRKKKDYEKEIKILELGIQRQVHNTGVAPDRFTDRLDRARKLQRKQYSK